MTNTALRGRAAALSALRSLALVGALAVALGGCSAGASVSTDDIIPDVAELGDPGGDSGGDSSGGAGDVGDDEVTVIGAELVSGFAGIAAEQYAKGRDPIPVVEFTSSSAVTFTFGGTLDELTLVGNCQIAYGVLDAEGIDITIVDDSGSTDCTALIEG